MPFDLEKPTECPACSTIPDGKNICSPYDRLTWAIYNFNYCPMCGRYLDNKHNRNITENE